MSRPEVLITGGAGFIGSRLASRLLAHGWRVVIADSLHPQVHGGFGWPAAIPDGVVTYPIDVTSAAQWDAMMRLSRPDVVVHLAAETGTGKSLLEASRHANVNVLGTAAMIDGYSRAGHTPSKFVLASSRAVYGEGRWTAADGTAAYALPRTAEDLNAGIWNPRMGSGSTAAMLPESHVAAETDPRPSNVYAATKLAQEHILSAWTVAMGSSLSVLRLQNVYGPGQSLTNPYTGVLTFFAGRALAGQPIDVYEDGEIVRDFVFIDDVVDALFKAAVRERCEPLLADIGSATPVTLYEVAKIMAAESGGPAPFISGRFRLGDVRAASADITHAAAELDYSPSVTIEEGIARLMSWVRASR